MSAQYTRPKRKETFPPYISGRRSSKFEERTVHTIVNKRGVVTGQKRTESERLTLTEDILDAICTGREGWARKSLRCLAQKTGDFMCEVSSLLCFRKESSAHECVDVTNQQTTCA